jgi:hypothetical protein
MSAEIHKSKFGTYHPNPKAEVAWTINDTRGYIDGGPSCDECGSCDHFEADCEISDGDGNEGCSGLSFAFVCLDGGDALCADCAEKEGIEIVECDCP